MSSAKGYKNYSIVELADFLNGDVGRLAISKLNEEFCKKQLVKLPNEHEPLPDSNRQLSSYRTRLGTMMEYALATFLFHILRDHLSKDLSLTFAVAHEYPDFIVRDSDLNPVFRIEMKAVDADSDEHAARFETQTSLVKRNIDLLLFLGWKWDQIEKSGKPFGSYPRVFNFLFVPAIEIAQERDRRLIESGGKIEDGKVLVPKRGKPNSFVDDPGNFGKFRRIVHGSRRSTPDKLSKSIQQFLAFIESVDAKSSQGKK